MNKRRVHERDEYVCQYCAVDLQPDEATSDHIHPKSRGGSGNSTNLTTACAECNQRKGGRTPAESRMPLLREVGILRSKREPS